MDVVYSFKSEWDTLKYQYEIILQINHLIKKKKGKFLDF